MNVEGQASGALDRIKDELKNGKPASQDDIEILYNLGHGAQMLPEAVGLKANVPVESIQEMQHSVEELNESLNTDNKSKRIQSPGKEEKIYSDWEPKTNMALQALLIQTNSKLLRRNSNWNFDMKTINATFTEAVINGNGLTNVGGGLFFK